jgi:lysozyme
MARKKRKNLLLRYLLIGFVLLSVAYTSWRIYLNNKDNFVTYPEFGIAMPEQYAIHGIDVSHHQDNINWELVSNMQVKKIKMGFAFIKATEGIGRVDRKFNRNWKRAKDAGIPCGAYHFFLATKSGKLQAENFISTVQLEKGDLPPVLDVEQTYGVTTSKLQKEVKAFLNTVSDYYGVTPIIYTNTDFYRQHLNTPAFETYPLWVAHYLQQKEPRVVRNWLFWQHSETGRVNGITTKVDFNVFNGDTAAFEQLLFK